MSKALFFDCDGVLADTERDGHLVAFNRMWQEKGIRWQWNLGQYAEKLKIGGGKERMATLAGDAAFRAVYEPPASEQAWRETIAVWHQRKTQLYEGLIASGAIPGRPGVKRLAEDALSGGWILAVCSTSALPAVQAVLTHVVGPQTAGRFAGIYAGDMVKAKKPAPDVYLLAAQRLGIDPVDCVVVEDSRNGLLAARAAGMKCIITCNELTRGEDFREADLVLTCLGDPGGKKARVLQNRTEAGPQDYLRVEDLEKVLRTTWTYSITEQ
jgi:HAD superfamily hydrolase (TIGR01509 family)